MHMYIYIHTYLLFQILFLYRLLQNIEYSSLCSIVLVGYLILYIVVCLPHLSPWVTANLFSMSVSLFLFCT